jgi:glucuronate isomerase
MSEFLKDNFLLHFETSRKLFCTYAKDLPIIDYHCHLPVEQIAADINFENLTQIWLYGDHYKWRAMRTNGVSEDFITGGRSDYEKFEKWAETVPYTLRNPLYHWTHLELNRYFGIEELLNPKSVRKIYDSCSELLRSQDYSVRNLLRKMKVEVVCTTDDPVDDLSFHRKIKEDGFEIKVLPAFRPDNTMELDDAGAYHAYLSKLEKASGISITSYQAFLDALKQRHDFFASMGCCLSDHGVEHMYADEVSDEDAGKYFNKILNGRELLPAEKSCLKSSLLETFAIWDHEKGWVQQYHIGALRNNNTRMTEQTGTAAGWDSIGDYSQAETLVRFLDKLNKIKQLTKTVLYNLNPADNEVMATMIGNFNEGDIPGKVQLGSGWWFLDQKDGMTRQMNALSNMGLLSRFVGMVTDSRSFLSYPRHEYFRRILCNLFGEEIEKGELPGDIEWIGKVIKDICYYNAKSYFGWKDQLSL